MSPWEAASVAAVAIATLAFMYASTRHRHKWNPWEVTREIDRFEFESDKYPYERTSVITRTCETCGLPQSKEVKR